jgi:hypothetical protein
MRKIPQLLASAILTAGLIMPTVSLAQRIIVDGNLWMNSSVEVRKAFLVGAGNMAAMEKAYATKKGTPQPPAAEATRIALQGVTLDQLSERITHWYQANPDRRDFPVMAVIWTDIVKPSAAAAAAK